MRHDIVHVLAECICVASLRRQAVALCAPDGTVGPPSRLTCARAFCRPSAAAVPLVAALLARAAALTWHFRAWRQLDFRPADVDAAWASPLPAGWWHVASRPRTLPPDWREFLLWRLPSADLAALRLA